MSGKISDPSSHDEAKDDDSRLDEAAFLSVTLAAAQPVPEPVCAGVSDAPDTGDGLPDPATNLETASARTLAFAKPLAETTGDVLARAEALLGRLVGTSNLDALRDAAQRAATAIGTDPASLDTAAVAARRALDAALNVKVSQDRLASQIDAAALRRQADAQLHTPRASALSLNDIQRAVAAFNDNASAGDGSEQGFASSRNNTPIAMLASRALHGLVPVPFELSIDNAPHGLSASASVSVPNEAGVSSSIVQALRLQVTAGGGSAVINLSPDFLGGVKVSVQVDNGAVTAMLHANNPQVRAWMETNESALRQALLDHGLRLDRLVVTDDAAPEFQREGEPHTGAQDDQPRQRRRDNGERFELVA